MEKQAHINHFTKSTSLSYKVVEFVSQSRRLCKLIPYLPSCRSFSVLLLLAMIGLSSCRKDDDVVMPTVSPVASVSTTHYAGLYLLCEGNMGANKATLDYLDLATGQYQKNIFPSRNPDQVKELGDVGNDCKIYGQRLWLVVNCSNKVEVCDAATARSLGHVNIPNCRSLAFHEGYAYVSSYVGKVGGSSVLGSVYKVDTLTLRIEGQVSVGYQPEEMAVREGKLYVANSGGYQALQGGDYDRTVSIIDLQTFTLEGNIDVAPNLFRLRTDRRGQLWTTSRGIEGDGSTPARLFMLDGTGVKNTFDLPVSDFCLRGDSLCYLATNGHSFETGIIDTSTGNIVSRQLLKPSTAYTVETPYGIIVNPETGHVYLMDATNYVSSGWLLCFDPNGEFLWRTSTGDIPGHAAFVAKNNGSIDKEAEEPPFDSRYIQAVDEYVPAPGQFVNLMPVATDEDTPQTMAQKCTEAIGGGRGGLITLGAYGGYVTFHFDHPIANVEGERDFAVWGNAFENNAEPAIVMVSQDANGNGRPDDAWYELRGSAHDYEQTVRQYQITYTYDALKDVPWTDNQGRTGCIPRNTYHKQEYFPLWLKGQGTLVFNGTLLPRNARLNGTTYELPAFDYGYADNRPNTDRQGCSMDIGWAEDGQGRAVSLTHIDFVRCYTALNQVCDNIGETSSEIKGAEDLHLDLSLLFVEKTHFPKNQ